MVVESLGAPSLFTVKLGVTWATAAHFTHSRFFLAELEQNMIGLVRRPESLKPQTLFGEHFQFLGNILRYFVEFVHLSRITHL